MKALFWTPPAEADLHAIDDYWWALDPEAADRALGHIEEAAQFLRSVPDGGSLIERGDIRKWRAAPTPYILIYRVRGDTVQILRVHHDRQNWRPA